MNGKGILYLLFLITIFASCSKKIIPDKPFLSQSKFLPDSLPLSEINIPFRINLKPLYELAEKQVPLDFTSPNWPEDWITLNCASRYKYYFRRSPLQFQAQENILNIGFTGHYKIIGSTRACVAGAVITPWSPPCRCGFEEGERKVKLNFRHSFSVLPDYKISSIIRRDEPAPVDKCNVCFFGADITGQVMQGMKDELDLAKKAMEDSFGIVNVKPFVQAFWNKLSVPYNLYDLGWLQINPQKIRLNEISTRNDTLNISLGLLAQPVIGFEKPAEKISTVPALDYSASNPGFNIFLNAVLNYDSLSKILNAQISGRQFEFKKGNTKKTFIVKECRIYGSGNEKLIIKMSFTGSNNGIAYFTGKPVYDDQKKTIEVRDIDFDVKTKNLFLKSADWLFNRRIVNEISQVSRFELSAYLDPAKTIINNQLNREWMKGIKNSGTIHEIHITGIYPLSDHFVVRSNASGELAIQINSIDFNF